MERRVLSILAIIGLLKGDETTYVVPDYWLCAVKVKERKRIKVFDVECLMKVEVTVTEQIMNVLSVNIRIRL